MRKRLISILSLACLLVCLFASCTGKTPDQIAAESEAALTLETTTWSLEVEGAEASTYTREEAEAHELTKIIGSMIRSCEPGSNGTGWIQTSFIMEGITLKEFLEDVGAPNATKLTYYGTNLYDEEVSFTVESEYLQSDEVVLGWILNKTELPFDSKTFVGIYAASSISDFDSCTSISKVVIE